MSDEPARVDATVATPAPPAAEPFARRARRRAPALLAFLLAAAGAAVAIVLVREYLDVLDGDLAGGLFCGGGGRFNCAQVAAHPASTLLGMPVALWGLLFYVVVAGCALGALLLRPAARAAAAHAGLFLVLVGIVFDAYLAWTMITQIGAICLNCVATYGINLLLALALWGAERAAGAPRSWRALLAGEPLLARIGLAAFVVAGVATAITRTWEPLADLRKDARRETQDFLDRAAGPPEIDMRRFDGLPARGPVGADLTIVVAGDFECGYCRALSQHVDRLQRENPGRIRVVFLNSPVNPDCHPIIKHSEHIYACWLAQASIAAAAQGRFWPYHDYVYNTLPLPQVTHDDVVAHYAAMGIDPARLVAEMASGRPAAELAREVALSDSLKLYEVPTIVINGHPRRAGVYPEMLRAVVHAMLHSR